MKGRTDHSFDEENLIICILDLFSAGTETSATTMRWALIYMAKNPEIQGKSPDQAYEAFCCYSVTCKWVTHIKMYWWSFCKIKT